MSAVLNGDVIAVVGELLHSRQFIADAVCAADRQRLRLSSVENVAVAFNVVVIDCFRKLIFIHPVVYVLLGERIVDFYLGVSVIEFQCGYGICLRRCLIGVHPVGSLLCALVVGRGCQECLYAVNARAVVECLGIWVISHIFVAQLVHHFLDVGIEIPRLAVGGGELDVVRIFAVDLRHEIAATVDDEKPEGVTRLEVACYVVVVHVEHHSPTFRLVNDNGFKPHGCACIGAVCSAHVIIASREQYA